MHSSRPNNNLILKFNEGIALDKDAKDLIEIRFGVIILFFLLYKTTYKLLLNQK